MSDKASFKALREMVGYSQKALADALGIDVRNIRRWESAGSEFNPKAFAWEYLEELRDRQLDIVSFAVQKAEDSSPDEVLLTIYQSQDDYDATKSDGGYFGFANATAYLTASFLNDLGHNTRFEYANPE